MLYTFCSRPLPAYPAVSLADYVAVLLGSLMIGGTKGILEVEEVDEEACVLLH